MKTSASYIWRKNKDIKNEIGARGKVVSFTIIRSAPLDFQKQAPYAVVLVKLVDGKTRMGQLVDSDLSKVRIGIPVISVVRRLFQKEDSDLISYGIKFKPL